MICPACHSNACSLEVKNPKDVEYFSERKVESSFMKCDSCASLFQNPWPSAEELGTLYPKDYQNYTRKDIALLSKFVDMQNRAVARNFVKKFGKNISVLDFGCGDGRFLKSLHDEGLKDLIGYEPHMRGDGVYSNAGYVLVTELSTLHNKRFDIIRMNHVIEHLSSIDDTMRSLADLLAPGGKILVQTPNPDTLTRNIFRKFWGALHYPYHTVLFTPEGIKAGAARWNLYVSSVQGSAMPTGWSMSLENIIKTVTKSKRRGRLPVYGFLAMGGMAVNIVEKTLLPKRTAIIDYVLEASQ
jgi:SAM-dependent methyltransferase